MSQNISVDRHLIAAFCQRHGIEKLSLYGSLIRGGFNDGSDIDVLVTFRAGATPSFFKLFEMEEELSALFGRKVDLRTPEDLSRYFRAEVLSYAEEQYAE